MKQPVYVYGFLTKYIDNNSTEDDQQNDDQVHVSTRREAQPGSLYCNQFRQGNE